MWVFQDGHKYTPTGGVNKITHHAGEIYATLPGRNVGVYHIFGQESTSETLIDLSSYFTNDPYYICNGSNSVFVFEKGSVSTDHEEEFITSFVEISTTTREVTRHITLPLEAHNYPTVANQKIWFTTKAVASIDADDTQSLFFFDINAEVTNQWSTPVEIPGNKQFIPHKITWGKESYVFVDGFNENSVYKFNDSTGAYISQIIVNRKPLDMFTNGNRELLIASYSGMVSTVNQTTDTPSNVYATPEEATTLIDDGTYLWSVSPTLTRTSKSTSGSPAAHDVIRMDAEEKDFSIVPFSESSFNDILVLPLYNHDEWDVDNEVIINVTELQHIVLSTDTAIFVATNLNDSWDLEEIRPYYLSVNGTAMVATGPEKYYGETE